LVAYSYISWMFWCRFQIINITVILCARFKIIASFMMDVYHTICFIISSSLWRSIHIENWPVHALHRCCLDMFNNIKYYRLSLYCDTFIIMNIAFWIIDLKFPARVISGVTQHLSFIFLSNLKYLRTLIKWVCPFYLLSKLNLKKL
jgi:hypothetical protein